MPKNMISLFVMLAILALMHGSGSAAEWGDLTGRFVYKGDPPARKELNLKGDVAYCGKFKPLDPSLIVDKEGGIKDVVVSLFINYKGGEKAPKAHESYKKSADAKIVLDNDKCLFEPHVVFVRVSQTLILRNSDDTGHNVNFTAFDNKNFNIKIPANSEEERKFDRVDRHPGSVSCGIHMWMTARVIIRDHPYVAITNKQGKFTIKNLPAGKHTFQFQHEAGYVQQVETRRQVDRVEKGTHEI